GAVLGEDRGGDGRRDHDQQERGTGGGQLLGDDRQLGDAAAPAAVLGRDVHAEVPELAGLGPQLGGVAAGARLLAVIPVAVLGAEVGDGGTQGLLLGGLIEGGHEG